MIRRRSVSTAWGRQAMPIPGHRGREPRGQNALSLAPAAPLLVQLRSASASAVQPIAAADGVSLMPSGLTGVLEATGSDQSLGKLAQDLTGLPVRATSRRVGTLSISKTPNDPKFTDGTLWGMNGTYGINAPSAWDVTTGSNKVTVADIDTGIDYNHPDLYQNIWINQAEIPPTPGANLTDVDGDGLITFCDLNNPSRTRDRARSPTSTATAGSTRADILAPMARTPAATTPARAAGPTGYSEDGDTAHLDDLIGWNFVTNTNNPFDDNGHGTHTAGTIGAMGNNGVGVVGVNWQVQIMAAQVPRRRRQRDRHRDAAGDPATPPTTAPASPTTATAAAVAAATLPNAITDAGNQGRRLRGRRRQPAARTTTSPRTIPRPTPTTNIIAVAAIGQQRQPGRLLQLRRHDRRHRRAGRQHLQHPARITATARTAAPRWPLPTSPARSALVLGQHPTWTYSQVIQQVLSTATPDAALAGKTVTGGILNAAARGRG